jgi:hypothetical protein
MQPAQTGQYSLQSLTQRREAVELHLNKEAIYIKIAPFQVDSCRRVDDIFS